MRSLAILALIGCGSVTVKPDATTADGPPDVAADGARIARHYVLDHERVPQTSADAAANGLDVNGDGAIDNQLGSVFATMAQMGFDSQTPTTSAVDQGRILLLLDFESSDLTTATGASVATLIGANPVPAACNGATDAACRHHLTGNGSFGIDASFPRHPAVTGDVAGGVFTSTPGTETMSIQVAPFGSLIELDVIGARVKLESITDAGVMTGILAGGVVGGDLANKILPSFQTAVMAIVQRDCPLVVPPSCGCAAGSAGATLIGLFDTNQDCRITVAEIASNNLVQSLLAPDLTIGGQQALSIGLGFTAVHGDFTP